MTCFIPSSSCTTPRPVGRRILLLLACFIAALTSAAPARAGETLAILPASFTLHGPEARHMLLLERVRDGQYIGQIRDNIQITSSDPKVVRIENGVAIPVGDGNATLSATLDGATATAHVTVTGMDGAFDFSFRNHVQPVLAKFGCSTGACHGAMAGQNGFRLSLRGYDDEGDFNSLMRHALGRRIVPSDPARSLLLLKPTGAVPHKGGQRFTPDSAAYHVIADWIASGAKPPSKDDPRIQRIEIVPQRTILRPGDEQQLLVLAHFSDGSVHDVTSLARYNAVDTAVANVDETGLVRIAGSGEGTITAWYLSRIAIATITVPYQNSVSPEIFAGAPRRNLVDDLVLEKLQRLKLPPSPPASDSQFIRRAFLDTIGLLPTPEEVRAFLADPGSDKRDRLIESLLSRPEFVDYWAYKWSDLLLVSSSKLRPPAMWAYHNWIRDQVAANTPWDTFARQLITARGSTLENGAANFFILHDNPIELSETVSVAMLGMAINCARCHNHPLEKWTNDQYYAMANLFARVRTKTGSGDGNFIIFSANEGDLIQPLTGRPQPPAPLDGRPMDIHDPSDRREHLADWLISRDNPYFTRAIVNRVWASFMGVGLVENVDDLRLTNPPSNEQLMSALADYLAERGYDLKALMRLILQSATYQHSSQPMAENAGDTRLYSRYYPRRLMAEVLLDSISQVTGVPTRFEGYPDSWRALQLPDSNVESHFLKTFGRADRVATCECERTADPSMAQVLHIANGDTINQKLEAEGNRIDQLLAAGTPDQRLIEEAYLSALSRHPTDQEQSRILAVWSESGDTPKRILLEDLYWSILSSNEFLFNH